MSVGKRVEATMLEKGIDQQTLAARAGVTQGYISQLIAGQIKSPREATLQRLANALEVPATSLMSGSETRSEQNDSLEWIWQRKFAIFKAGDVLRYRQTSPTERMAWCIRQLLDRFTLAEISNRLEQPAEHVQAIADGKIEATPALIDLLVERADVPANWLLYGDSGAPDELLKTVLQHRDGSAYLAIAAKAIKHRILPVSLDHELDDLIQTVQLHTAANEKSPT